VVDGCEHEETDMADLTVEVGMVDAPDAGALPPWAIRILTYRQDHTKNS